MGTFCRLMAAESFKLKRSAALRVVWLVPLLFLVLEFLVFERPAMNLHALSSEFSATFDTLQLQMIGALWAGLFHPLLVAMLPALLFRPEHRFKLWRHLHTMPVSRRSIFLAKALWLMLLSGLSLALVALGLWCERCLIAWFNPLLAFPFHGVEVVKAMAWLWLGSVPLLSLYLWVSDRINSLAVPVVFGLVGLLLTISLSGAEVPQPWKRDLIPWVLPYFCVQQTIKNNTPRQTVHTAGKLFQEEPNVLRLPSGKKVKTFQNVPDDVLFPPPTPTPMWILGTFSVSVGLLLLGLGVLEAGRNRI